MRAWRRETRSSAMATWLESERPREHDPLISARLPPASSNQAGQSLGPIVMQAVWRAPSSLKSQDWPRSHWSCPSSLHPIRKRGELIDLKPIAQASNHGRQILYRARLDQEGIRPQIKRPLHVLHAHGGGNDDNGQASEPRLHAQPRQHVKAI